MPIKTEAEITDCNEQMNDCMRLPPFDGGFFKKVFRCYYVLFKQIISQIAFLIDFSEANNDLDKGNSKNKVCWFNLGRWFELV